MAITKTSGAIAMSEIQTEFGGSNPISMSEYYGDGSYVSDGAADGDGNAIPESGAISISHFVIFPAAPGTTVIAFSPVCLLTRIPAAPVL